MRTPLAQLRRPWKFTKWMDPEKRKVYFFWCLGRLALGGYSSLESWSLLRLTGSGRQLLVPDVH